MNIPDQRAYESEILGEKLGYDRAWSLICAFVL